MNPFPALSAFAVILPLAACGSGAADGPAPGADAVEPSPAPTMAFDEPKPYEGIAENERIQFTGTEPFWAGEVSGRALTYKTPENPSGEIVSVDRFAGRGGISFTGTLAGTDFAMAFTPSTCSDGMSDRSYPFTVTLRLGEDTRRGCGWTDRQPFAGPANP